MATSICATCATPWATCRSGRRTPICTRRTTAATRKRKASTASPGEIPAGASQCCRVGGHDQRGPMATSFQQIPARGASMRTLRWKGGLGADAGLVLVVALALVFASLRAIGMLGPPQARVLLPLGFVGMALAPLLLLDRTGWRQIGLALPSGARPMLHGVAAGTVAALACFGTAWLLAGPGTD